MTTTQVSLADATDLRPDGDGRFTLDVSPAWAIGDKAHGGYLLAVIARAALSGSPHPHPVAVSAHFAAAPGFAPATVTVDEVKRGKATATYRAVLEQDGRRCVDAIVTTARLPERPTAQWSDGESPRIPPLDQCDPSPNMLPNGTRLTLLDQLEVRLDPTCAGWAAGRPTGALEMRAWVRLRDGSTPDPLALLVIADALPPLSFNVGRFGWAPTVQLAPLLRGLASGEWLQVLCSGRLLADDWFDSDAQVWDSSGALVMQARQLAIAGRGL